MDAKAFSYVNELLTALNKDNDSRTVVENFLAVLRREFVFDNVAAYLQDDQNGTLDIVYARAVGRAKNAEADAAWGEDIAVQVLAKKQLLTQDPEHVSSTEDRIRQAYLLGLPLHIGGTVNGALVFVRFGGPDYIEDHIAAATLSIGPTSRFEIPAVAMRFLLMIISKHYAGHDIGEILQGLNNVWIRTLP